MIDIIRLEKGKNEILGVLMLNKQILCYTLELPNLDNKNDVSCIPTGNYKATIGLYHGKEKWLINDVPKRTGIFIHAGNTHRDILGCILLGSNVGYIGDDRAVLGSANAVNELMTLTKGRIEIEVCVKSLI